MVNPKKFWLLFLPIFALSLYLFLPSLNYYFFQDDWFVLNWIRTGNIASFFSFRTDIIYWRPLSMPLLFATTKAFFGLNPQAFHALAFGIFVLLVIVIYNLFLILAKDKKLAIIAAFMYAIWPIHYVSLSWFSTTSYIIGPLFQCLSFIYFLKTRRLLTYLFFFLGLMSSEFTIVLPAIFFAWSFFEKKKMSLKFIAPLFITDVIYFVLRFVIFAVPASGSYSPVFNLQLLYNFIWYVLWAIGFPESFKYLVFPSQVMHSIKILTQFWTISLPTVIISTILASKILSKFKKRLQNYIFGLFWLTIGLAPVITVTNHSYPMYLSFAGLGFIYIILTAIKGEKVLPIASVIVLWTLISITNLQFTRITHWARNEQAISKAYIEEALKKDQLPQQNSAFIFKSANVTFANNHNFTLVEGENNLGQALNFNDAMQVVYSDSSLKSIFPSNQQDIDLPKEINIIEVSPRED